MNFIKNLINFPTFRMHFVVVKTAQSTQQLKYWWILYNKWKKSQWAKSPCVNWHYMQISILRFIRENSTIKEKENKKHKPESCAKWCATFYELIFYIIYVIWYQLNKKTNQSAKNKERKNDRVKVENIITNIHFFFGNLFFFSNKFSPYFHYNWVCPVKIVHK